MLVSNSVEHLELEPAQRHHFCFKLSNENDVMLVEDNFFPEPKEHPSTITAAELCERFKTAGLPCESERDRDEVRIIFAGRKSQLVFTANPSGHLLTATMPEETDYDAEFAAIIFDVFEGIGWTYTAG